MPHLEAEKAVAVAAVLKASAVAQRVQADLVDNEKATKSDNSPVTVADYAAQALVSKLIFSHFPSYKLVGEEDSKDLHSDAQQSLREKITELANWAVTDHRGAEAADQAAWAQAGQESALSEKDWLQAIDQGDATETAQGRVWALDPIDGTKGFLRKGQYAVCLALMEAGEPTLGVIGCPNLPVDFKSDSSSAERGVVFVAVKGQGAFARSFTDATLRPISMSALTDLSQASFCESVEAGHSDQSTNANIAKALGITRPPTRMDSQAKYCSISRGDGDIYLRLPVKKDYEEKIWDHAAGALLVAEAGGKVTDCLGKPLDFSLGRTLKANKGIVASVASIHDKVIEAVIKAREGQ